jgi:hypothetical protein
MVWPWMRLRGILCRCQKKRGGVAATISDASKELIRPRFREGP